MPRKSFEHISLKKSEFNKQHSEYKTRKHEDFIAGIAPNLRGSQATMYITKPWEIKQNSCFYSAEESNAFYRRNLDAGQKEIAIAFDNDKFDFTINSVEDIKVLFDKIPLDKITVHISIKRDIVPLLAFYIVTAQEQGVAPELLSGTIQSEIVHEPTNNSTLKIVAAILNYSSKKMPNFNCIPTVSFQYPEANVSAEIELAYTLANGLEFIQQGIEAGMPIDFIASKLYFSWAIGRDHFTEIAKLRAARMLWAKIVKQFNPKNQKSMVLQAHCQTNGSTLTTQDPFNNVARTTIEAMAAVFGGAQSLHTTALDEMVDFPSDTSARIARNTQLFLQQETHITKTVDPWAGSYQVEKRTEEIANKAWELFKEIEDLGGITKAIEKGVLKMHIEEAVAKKQARIENGKDVIVGANAYQLKQEDTLQTLKVDKEAIRKLQIERLQELKLARNLGDVLESLENLKKAAKNDEENLLELAVIAARNRATLGEISDALAVVFS